jgi:flagellin
MSLRVNNNIAAVNAYRNLSSTDNAVGKSLEKLSSGFRINRAGDDAAGLVISENLRQQIGGLKVASRNAQDAISVVQTAEGALTEVTAMLQRAGELTTQKANGTYAAGGAEATAIETELTSLGTEITRQATATKFNGQSLLDGSFTAKSFQIGSDTGDTTTVDIALNLATVGAAVNSTATSDDIKTQLAAVTAARGALGASQNTLEHTINSLGVSAENLQASESRIRDTDMASEMTTFSKNQILSQAGTAMLAQANSSSQGVLQLLRG